MQITTPNRRHFLLSTAVAVPAMALPAGAAKMSDVFAYEVTRTDAEWKAMLTDEQFRVMREGDTELPANGPLWKDYSAGEFYCRGCDLHVYSSEWRVEIDKGWIFFSHSQPDAVLMSIDHGTEEGMDEGNTMAAIETHCRRCGSHLGHIVAIDDQIVHCINAASLLRDPPVV